MRAILTAMMILSVVPVVAAQTGVVDERTAPKTSGPPGPSRGNLDRFAQDASSILIGKCVACHGPAKKKGGST